MDDQQAETLLKNLETVFNDEQEYKRLLGFTEEKAQSLLDLLQTLSMYPNTAVHLRSTILKTMLRLNKNTNKFPTFLSMSNVQKTKVIAHGGFSSVHQGTVGESVVCLKIPRIFEADESTTQIQDFMKEAIIWRQFDHPNVLPIQGLAWIGSEMALISPWMKNGNLRSYLDLKEKRREQICDVASGLAYLHGLKVIHGDLKSLNVLVTDNDRASLADFGHSNLSDSARLHPISSMRSGCKGTAHWMAPEVLTGSASSYQSDIYAFACLVYEIYAGHHPFHDLRDVVLINKVPKGERPPRPAQTPDPMWSLIQSCWEHQPLLRPNIRSVMTRLGMELDDDATPRAGWDSAVTASLWRNMKQDRGPMKTGIKMVFEGVKRIHERLFDMDMSEDGPSEEFKSSPPGLFQLEVSQHFQDFDIERSTSPLPSRGEDDNADEDDEDNGPDPEHNAQLQALFRCTSTAQIRRILNGESPPSNLLHESFEVPFKFPYDATEEIFNIVHAFSGPIPLQTEDTTMDRLFSDSFLEEEVDKARALLHIRHSKEASGLDAELGKRIEAVRTEVLVQAFNANPPLQWLTSALEAEQRSVGMECCLLRMFSLVLDARIRTWARLNKIIPPSQSGFQDGYKSLNNPFVLRCVLDRVMSLRSNDARLFVAHVDLRNALPSVDSPVLWTKIHRLGISGPIFDRLRLVYAKSRLLAQQDETFVPIIKSLMGASASPDLWSIFFSDLSFPSHANDVSLNDEPVSHLEQLDGVVLFSTSLPGLQEKLDVLRSWCTDNSVFLTSSNTTWMIFGPPLYDSDEQPLNIAGEALGMVEEFKYNGLLFTAEGNDTSNFAAHHKRRTKKTCDVVDGLFTAAGTLPPKEGLDLYNKVIERGLIFGSQITLKQDSKIEEIEKVQLRFLRKILEAEDKSERIFLFTETGVFPIAVTKAISALKFVRSLHSLPPDHYSLHALKDSISLTPPGGTARAGIWAGELRNLLSHKSIEVILPNGAHEFGSASNIDRIIAQVREGAHSKAANMLQSSKKLLLLKNRVELDKDGYAVNNPAVAFRAYFSEVKVVKHRNAFIRLLTSTHILAVEQLRYERPLTPRERRFCRFCRDKVEDEPHAMLLCEGSAELKDFRTKFLRRLFRANPTFEEKHAMADPAEFLRIIVHSHKVLPMVARFTFEVLSLYEKTPMLNPSTTFTKT